MSVRLAGTGSGEFDANEISLVYDSC